MANRVEIQRVFHDAPYIEDLGLELVSCDHGVCITALILKEKHLQHDGYVHAGVQAAVADHTAGTAAASMLAADQIVLSANISLSLLRPGEGQLLRCKARILKPGRRLMIAESEIWCVDGEHERLTAKATVTLAIVE